MRTMNWLLTGLLLIGALLALAPTVGAVTTSAGFTAEVFATSESYPADEVKDIAFGPGGDFGTDLVVVVNNPEQPSLERLLRVQHDGTVSPYASAPNGPWGLAFSSGGTFGNYLYMNGEDVPDGLSRIDPLTLSREDGLAYINEGTALAISPGGAFGEYLYAGQAVGDGWQNSIIRVDGSFNTHLWHTFEAGTNVVDLTFSQGGSFGAYLYGTLKNGDGSADVVRLDSVGTLEILSHLPGAGYCYLDFSPGGPWGDYLYVTSNSLGQVLRVDSTGGNSVFASDFDRSVGLAFSPDGSALFVAQSKTMDLVVAIAPVPEPATLSVLVLGGIVLLRRRSS